ncbi:MAG: helix-turn-helix domain-containing protein, partial [Acidimicrobiia bacterium]|nr:helix-turn-helix domain-containing protein [Acidimicrobiia bacterium]
MFKVDAVELGDEVRATLEQRARSQTLPVRTVKRAQMVLLCADGVPLRQIAERVSISEHQVTMWRRRFLADGLDGLADRPRPGRPRRLGHDERMKMAAIATSAKEPNDPVATWTYFDVAAKLVADGIQVSVSQVWRILSSMDIDLTKVRGWLNRRD